MRQLLLISILSLTCLSIATGQVPYEQNLLSNVNPAWKKIALTMEQKQQVRECQHYTQLIQLHLSLVAEKLRAVTKELDLTPAIELRRLNSIDVLTEYYRAGLFPHNNKTKYTTPIFVDDAGTHCAVGYLMHRSGQDDVVSQIAKENNLAYVDELNEQYEALGTWAAANGFTVEELAWIQPGYSCHPDILPGEVIQPSCYGGYDGAFLIDITHLIETPNTVITTGDVFRLFEEGWLSIGSSSDCLPEGHYKQQFGVSSNDTTSLVELFVDIGQPDSIAMTYEITGKPSWCQGYINPTITGATPPFSIQVFDQEWNLVSLGPLCDGLYRLAVLDSMQCYNSFPVSVVEPAIECDAFCITDIRLNDPIPDYLNITIFFEGDNEDFINYPYVQAVLDAEGDTIATGTLNFFGQIGNTSQVYTVETTLDSLPNDFTASIVFNYDTNTCILSYPCLTSGVKPVERVELSIFPNPFISATYIKPGQDMLNGTLTIWNMQGQRVRSFSLTGEEVIKLDRGDLPAGQYTIRVLGQNKIAIGKLIILD